MELSGQVFSNNSQTDQGQGFGVNSFQSVSSIQWNMTWYLRARVAFSWLISLLSISKSVKILTASVSFTTLINLPMYSASIAELALAELAILDSNYGPAIPVTKRSWSTRFEQNGGKSWWFAQGFFISGSVANVLHKRFYCIAFN